MTVFTGHYLIQVGVSKTKDKYRSISNWNSSPLDSSTQEGINPFFPTAWAWSIYEHDILVITNFLVNFSSVLIWRNCVIKQKNW